MKTNNKLYLILLLLILLSAAFSAYAKDLSSKMISEVKVSGSSSNGTDSSNNIFKRLKYITYESNKLKRQYILSHPNDRKKIVPLIIVLHGTYGTGIKMERALGFNKYVEAYNFAVAYPDAYTPPGKDRTLRWNDGRDTLDSSKYGIDDVQAIRDMVDDIAKRIPLDRTRIYVTGASNGGIMTYRLACEAADLFSKFAPVIGNVALATSYTCNPSRPVSMLAINGTDDPFVPYSGGTVCKDVSPLFCEKGEVISSKDSIAIFAKNANCSSTPTSIMLPPTVNDGTQVEAVTFNSCQPDIKVQAYWIHGGGHVWPPRQGQLGTKSGTATQNLDATIEIIKFFLDK